MSVHAQLECSTSAASSGNPIDKLTSGKITKMTNHSELFTTSHVPAYKIHCNNIIMTIDTCLLPKTFNSISEDALMSVWALLSDSINEDLIHIH